MNLEIVQVVILGAVSLWIPAISTAVQLLATDSFVELRLNDKRFMLTFKLEQHGHVLRDLQEFTRVSFKMVLSTTILHFVYFSAEGKGSS